MKLENKAAFITGAPQGLVLKPRSSFEHKVPALRL